MTSEGTCFGRDLSERLTSGVSAWVLTKRARLASPVQT